MLPTDCLKILFEYMMKGDGYRGKGGDAYFTTSKCLADDLQEILLKIGLTGNLRVSGICRSGKPLYEVSILKPVHNQPVIRGNRDAEKYVEEVNYEGVIWCVTTTNGVIYVRRNGKTVWTGNSWGFGAWKSMTEDEFKGWWKLRWKGEGLNESLLEILYQRMEVWLKRLREEKVSLGKKVKETRLRLALSL
jgi:hypothetical protein